MFSFELEEIPAYAGMAMFKTRSALRCDLFSFQGARGEFVACRWWLVTRWLRPAEHFRRSSLVARPSLVEARRAEDKGSPYY